MRLIFLIQLLLFFIISYPLRAQEREAQGVASEAMALPRGDLFKPLVADPKEIYLRLSAMWVNPNTGDSSTLGLISAGESVGLLRIPVRNGVDWLQFDIAGGIFSQFDFETPSSDLINTDFIAALPITYRHQDLAFRFRYYHQSSHLGDEFILNNNPDRLNLSFESLGLLMSHESRGFRFYGGGEYFVRRDPSDLEPGLLQIGSEYRQPRAMFIVGPSTNGRFIAALDIKMWQQIAFQPSIGFRTGVEFNSPPQPEPKGLALRVLVNVYYGLSPFGQFFTQDVKVTGVGLGLYFDL